MHAEKTTQSDTDAAGIFLRRNIVFERLRLLNRVFSDQRAQLILNALEDKER
jgi:intracellular multiplication protein IcmW